MWIIHFLFFSYPKQRDSLVACKKTDDQEEEEHMSVKSAIKNFRQSRVWKITSVYILARSRSNAESAIKRVIVRSI